MNNPRFIKKSVVVMLTLVTLLLLVVAPTTAQVNQVTQGRNVSSASSPQLGPTDSVELGTFLDDLLAKQMADNHIAGAAVSVVKDGKLFFAKGYGYADIEKGIPVDAEQTLFGIGSVGKTLTWTTVMQLAEQGKVDLDADVNKYLDFRIPDTYPQPVTLKHLMTHTSGFEERWAGSVAEDANEIVPAGEWLKAHMAARVRPPDDTVAYSNYNAMLAGYIVARVSGKSYDQYLQENIFDPLGMTHSTARQSIPENLRAFVSEGYTYKNGTIQKFPDWVPQPALVPSGGQKASVTDMARFMIAHLQNGRYSDANIPESRILKEDTAKQMRNIQYTPDPRFRGIANGFFDFSDNGLRTFGHRGYAAPMNSLLLFLPDQNLGVFVIYNSAGGANVTNPHLGFQRAFFDHYYPASAGAPVQPQPGLDKRMDRFVGSYRETAFPTTSFMKVAALFGGMTAQIRDSGDGALLVNYRGTEMRFVQVESLYFRQVGGMYAIAFREDAQGRITRMFLDPINYTAFDKLEWYETSGFNIPLLAVCVLVFMSMLLVAVVRFVWSRLFSKRGPGSRNARVANWVLVGVCLLNLLVVAGVAWGAMGGGMANELLEPPLLIKVALALGVLCVVLTVGAVVYAVLAWKDRFWGIAFRVYYTVVTVAAVAFVWFLNYWNLWGLRY
ncbi:MAG: serine hydrolase [Chloroflexi bacterium]|nr:serine hydrolase [Chloroflexota bacterium]